MDWLKDKLNFIPLVVNGEFLSEEINADDDSGNPERIYAEVYDWEGGIREKGCIYLDKNLNPCGNVIILYLFGDGRKTEEVKAFGKGEPKYYVNYKYCNDTDKDRYAIVHPLK